MGIDSARIAREAFFLYAETYLPDAAARDGTLAALQLCADGTARATPSVATYVFRPSPLAQSVGDRLHPGCVALESTELYLTDAGFRDHIATDEFRTGLRAMYRDVERLGARIFWIGGRPAADMLRNVFKSDPQARPVMPVREMLFDEAVHRAARVEDVAILSLALTLPPGQGAIAVEAVDGLADGLRAISFVAFFHPLAPQFLRVFFTVPLDADQSPTQIAALLRPIAAAGEGLTGHAQVHRGRTDLAAELAAALRITGEWHVSDSGYSGHILHPGVATDQERQA